MPRAGVTVHDLTGLVTVCGTRPDDAREERAALAGLLGVGPGAVAAGLAAARVHEGPGEERAIVAAVRALAADALAGADDPARALPVVREAVLRLFALVAGTDAAWRRFAARALPGRPPLDALRGRARLLEEARRDLLTQPVTPLPEPLDELCAEALEDGPPSPLLAGLEREARTS